MKRYSLLGFLLAVLIFSLSWASMPALAQTTATPPPQGTIVGPTSAVPTPGSLNAQGNLLPSGTLILLQKGQAIASTPNGQPISLAPERFGVQASGNYKLGVRFDHANNTVNLTLVDNSTGQTRQVPQGVGLNSPSVTWKFDGSGFAFFDLVPPGKTAPNAGAVLYFDVAQNATRILVPPPGAGLLAASVGWSPDGRYLFYLVDKSGGEGVGGPTAKSYLLDTTNKKVTTLPAEANGFNQWDRASKGFLTQRGDLLSGSSQLFYYSLDALTAPKALTPANARDLLADISPDGKRIVVSSVTGDSKGQPANLYTMNLDGSSRRKITDFQTAEQSVTAVVWGADGIYYSLSGPGVDTTWKIELDGSNPHQVGQGTLLAIVGV